ncbi:MULTISPECIES: DUF4180 domain-containing protein [Actinoalloteichus]|uniref:DUF4180 family protein n=1 Tax=Actinoalloteichus fjordicus TaxID=1612552 RepID=A0AAC9PU79_9PSEU|nr:MULTISPECIES: DUF4180 domain-containing protein [Actinoalloteichus]APU16671.1 putative DUF4180 family protein [Actinoalloteichus fjordicus]APU22737.1 putative DUF4180 family protein [Actinoalloteichus sp. GBA129-24]
MTDVLEQRAGVSVLVCDPAGPTVTTIQDALDLVGAAFLGAKAVAVPAGRLDESFYRLRTGFAGEVMQKFVNYNVRLAVIGDIAAHLASSSALRALVEESNRGRHVWFLPDLDALDARLAALA